jgi:hypothetical protein
MDFCKYLKLLNKSANAAAGSDNVLFESLTNGNNPEIVKLF